MTHLAQVEALRGEIDEVTRELVALVERRAELSQRVGALKSNADLPARDFMREERLLRQAVAQARGVLPARSIEAIVQQIIDQAAGFPMQDFEQFAPGIGAGDAFGG